jgi:formate dehydrogenase subunit beta
MNRGVRSEGVPLKGLGLGDAMIQFLRDAMMGGALDAVLLPLKVPAGDSFAYVLVKDADLLGKGEPLPPIISVPGGKAISSITRRGKGRMRIGAVMRPCEARAALELSKLGQVDPTNLVLISMDCPGALPLIDYIRSPEDGDISFEKAIREGDMDPMRPICQICVSSTAVIGDLHLALLEDQLLMISNSDVGDTIFKEMNLVPDLPTAKWSAASRNLIERRKVMREENLRELESSIGGLDNLLGAFDLCINCHNCMRVCPVCYCRLCYFDSRRMKHSSDDYMAQAGTKGSLRLPPDMMLFHIGRMTHMSLTCVSCGACEDACPASIPVAQIFSLVADRTQATFDYSPGRNPEEPLPLVVYREEELHEVDGE